jgi:2-dehydropantoate 2-reductase
LVLERKETVDENLYRWCWSGRKRWMKICVIGAGAIGGWMSAKLARAGEQVSVLARGDTLAAIRANGLKLIEDDTQTRVEVATSDHAETLGEQDLVVIAVKAPALHGVAKQISPLIGTDTMILSAMNGVPTWFFAREDRPLYGTPLATIDPDGAIARIIDPKRTIGCVVHASCSVDAPGVIRHKIGNTLIVGEACGRYSARLASLANTFRHAQFDVVASNDIQRDIWYKLWGNMTTNPVSALTGVTADKIVEDDLVSEFCIRAMREAQAIGAKIGIVMAESPEDRHGVTRKLGAFKTSMLQDVEANKPIELDALVSVVREIGQHVNEPTPNIDSLLGLTRLMARQKSLY